jgi:excisionase family DNA binding protein
MMLEIRRGTTPEGLLRKVRREAPGLLREPVPVPVPGAEALLTPGEVARMLKTHPRTVTRWAVEGRLTSIRTPGGHRRYREAEVKALLRAKDAARGKPKPRASRARKAK